MYTRQFYDACNLVGMTTVYIVVVGLWLYELLVVTKRKVNTLNCTPSKIELQAVFFR